jgi:hypothetical protein
VGNGVGIYDRKSLTGQAGMYSRSSLKERE